MKRIIVTLFIVFSLAFGIFVYLKTRSLISVFLCEISLLFFAEIVLRVFIIGELRFGWKRRISHRIGQNLKKPKMLAFQGHPYAFYVKALNSEGLYPSNNLGYVGKRPTSVEKPMKAVRIYCVGGSTIEFIDPSQGPDSHWPAKMQNLLNVRLGNEIVEVINAGVSGYTTAESLSEFAFRGIDLNPDILLIYHNVNDAWTVQMVDGFKNDYSHVRVQKPWKLGWLDSLPQLSFLIGYQLIRDKIISKFGKANDLIYQISNPPWRSTQSFSDERVCVFKRNIKNMIAIAQIHSIKPIMIKWEFDWNSGYVPLYLYGCPKAELSEKFIQYVKANNCALEELAKEYDVPFIDVGAFSQDYFIDSIHFNAKGLDEMATRVDRHIFPFINDIISKKR